MKITGAIFDMDGTLTDSMTMWRTLRQRYVRYKGCEPEENLDNKLAEMGWGESYDYLRKTYGIAIESDSEMYEDMKGYVAYYYKNEVALKKNVKELLEYLHGKGVKMCLASATDRWLCEMALEHCGIRHYFSELYGAPEFGKDKHSPDMFEAALAHMGTAKESTFVFEDALYSAKTAHEAGFPVLGIFDSTEAKQDELKAIADIYVQNYPEDVSSLFE